MRRIFVALPLMILLCGCSSWRALSTERKLAVVENRILSATLLVGRLDESGVLRGEELEAAKGATDDLARSFNIVYDFWKAGGDPALADRRAEALAADLAAFVAVYEKYVLEDRR